MKPASDRSTTGNFLRAMPEKSSTLRLYLQKHNQLNSRRRWIMFDWRNQLVKQAQLEDWRVKAEKERLLQQAQAYSQSPKPNPIGIRQPGLLSRIFLALRGRLAPKPLDETSVWDTTPELSLH
jgi:hypothetical protein